MILSFVCPGEPIAQPRPRAAVEKYGYGARAKYVPRLYECPKGHPVLEYKQTLASCARDLVGLEVMTCAMGVEIEFIRTLPQSMVRVKTVVPRRVFDGKPDIDNLAKAVLDSLLDVVWKDDGQVFGLRASKWYAAGDETAHTKVTIYTTVEEFYESNPQAYSQRCTSNVSDQTS